MFISSRINYNFLQIKSWIQWGYLLFLFSIILALLFLLLCRCGWVLNWLSLFLWKFLSGKILTFYLFFYHLVFHKPSFTRLKFFITNFLRFQFCLVLILVGRSTSLIWRVWNCFFIVWVYTWERSLPSREFFYANVSEINQFFFSHCGFKHGNFSFKNRIGACIIWFMILLI